MHELSKRCRVNTKKILKKINIKKNVWIKDLLIVFIIVSVLLGVVLFRNRNQDFIESFYQIQSDKVESNIRIVHLSDLHLKMFGNDNQNLLEGIKKLNPDLIAITGDMTDKNVDDYQAIITLCEKLVEIAPVYYSPGNHEWEKIVHEKSKIAERLKKCGVHFLADNSEIVNINDNQICIGGLAEWPEAYEKYGKSFLEEFEKNSEFKLLLVHYPEYFKKDGILVGAQIDLALCGHAHGGQIRIPGIGGLYTPDQGWFPKMTEGLHDIDNGVVVISRGLGDGMDKKIPRINNMPELVIIDINWY